jgi:hypothetical protein
MSKEELFGAWQNPGAEYRGAPFWSWNSRLDPARLVRQIEQMHAAGMGGFFMHSRYGLKTPYLGDEWFECVHACVEKARQLGMKAYLYDEDRWPSASAGGNVTREHPEFRLHYIYAQTPKELPPDAERVALFAVKLDAQGRCESYRSVEDGRNLAPGETLVAFDDCPTKPDGWYNDGTYPDTMNAEAVAEFLYETHRSYADRFGKDFGGVIPAIFTDEPNFGVTRWHARKGLLNLHWTPSLPREFLQRRGYDLRDRLPELAYARPGETFSQVRHDYYRTLTELFVENFTEQIGQWCEKNRIAMTGHMLEEQSLETQISAVGAAMPHYEHMQWPGIDMLCDQTDELSTAKQCSSVADQLGKPRVLSELYGCTGWDWPLEGHKFLGDWQYAVGVNFRCPHLTHYSLEGGAKRDYPASIYAHSPWWKYYRVVEDYFARLSLMLTQGTSVRDVLVLHPVESAWGLFMPEAPPAVREQFQSMQNVLTGLIRTLSNEHYDWDFADESLLAKYGKVSGASLKVGKMAYPLVIVPPCVTLRETTAAMLRKFIAGGGKVLFAGSPPTRIDAKENPAAGQLVASAVSAGAEPKEFMPVLRDMLPQRVSITENGEEARFVWYMLRAIRGGQLLFVQSHDRKNAHRVKVRVGGGKNPILWDAMTGRRQRLAAEVSETHAEFELDLPATGSALVSLHVAAKDAARPAEAPKILETVVVEGPFDIELCEDNTLPLDYCCYGVKDEPWSAMMPVLKAEKEIRARYKLPPRLNRGAQPWYLYGKGVVDTSPRNRCRMRWLFHVTQAPSRCLLAIERPGDFEISVNGRPVNKIAGQWLDEDIKTVDISLEIRPGENEILLSFDYRPDMELEELHLVGDFGVGQLGKGPKKPGTATLVTLPKRLSPGSWVGQGLDFYGGAVRYRLNVTKPAGSKRVRVRLPGIACTAAAIHAGGKTFVLPWAPFEADITDALVAGENDVWVEVIGGRKNILGPLHTPWERWTGPDQFDPNNSKWTDEYLLTDHGLMSPVVIETLA